MMEFWPENQGQSHLYSKYGTIPGRNCTHNCHDRHQPAHFPLYYGEQQDQSRESTYWTVPGSRTAGTLHEYTNWTDPELTAPSSSSHFPFILGRHTQHQDLGDYQLQEARDREWKAAHRPMRDHERGFLREGWQRRWDPCSLVRYNREVSAKRSDSSYRELEAWAARYSHSLPRRRRIEAELRGASQGLVERIGSDPQHVRQSGLWDRGGRRQTPTYYPSQAPTPDASNVLDMKENASYQRRLFNQPPGYIAPPPYNSPHQISPVIHSSDAVWEQDTKKQHCYSQPTHRKQHVSAEFQDKSKGAKEELAMSGESKTCPKFEGLKHQRFEADALQVNCPISVQQTHIQNDGTLPLQHPQVFQNSEINRETSSKVIEGRKFRLSKKTGGMTIFCLVSRIAGPTETPSLPVCTSKTNIQHTDVREASKPLGATAEANQKLPDEVDFKSSTLTEQSDDDAGRKRRETPPCTEKDMVEDNQAKKAEADVVPPQKENANDVCRQGGQSTQPVSVKYPLWREPSFTSRAETESPPTCCLKGNSEDKQSDDCVSSPPVDTEVRKLDIQEDAEDTKSLLVINTTCVVVKMEQIPSPTKEHVHFLSTAAFAEESQFNAQAVISPELNCQLNQNVTTDESTEEAFSCKNEKPETDVNSTVLKEEEGKQESEISLPCLLSSQVSGRETLEERAERILGIPLHDCITEPEAVMSLVESSAEERDEEGEPSPLKTDTEDAFKQTPEDAAEVEPSLNHLDDHQTKDSVCLKDHNDSRDQVASEDGGDFVGSQDQASDRHEGSDTDALLETGDKTLSETEKTEDALLESTDEKGTSEHGQEVDQPHETYSQPPEPSDSLPLIPSDHHSPSNISNTEEKSDPELAALNTADLALPPANSSPSPSHQLPSFLLDSESSSLSSPHVDSPCFPPPLVLTDQPAEETSGPEEEEPQTLHVTQSELINEPEVVMSQEQHECGQLDDTACVNDKQQNNGADEESIRSLEENYINILQQNLESVQTEGVLCLKESHVSEEQPEEGLPVESSEVDEESEENAGQTEAKILQQQLDCGQDEDVFCIKESHMTENELQTKSDELPVDIREQTLCKNNSSDSQSQTEIEILQNADPQTDPSNSCPPLPADCEVSLSPLDEPFLPQLPSPPQTTFECECVSLLDTSPIHPDAAAAVDIPETLPPPLSPEASPSSFSESPPVLPPSSTPPYEEESLTLSPNVLQSEAPKQALQYPKSLRDVVNRIRKHTAPDSENEEEEVTELWDPENLGENVAADTTSEKVAFDEVEQQKVSGECAEVGDIQHDHKAVQGDTEEDTLSCSSTSSHGSGDTVIGADENEAEEIERNGETEHRTEKESEVFKTAEAELHYSSEVKDEAEGEEEEEDEADTNEPCLSSECAAEIMETEVECEVIEL